MTFQIIEKQYKHDNCTELNEKIDEFISKWDFHSEGLNEGFMDIVLDHSKQKEREWDELYQDPTDWLESILIKREMDILNIVLEELKDILYVEKPEKQPNMNAKECMDWLIDNVKPLILKGQRKQSEIAKALEINPNGGLMTHRVKRAYHCNWKEYVEGVQHGRY